MIFVNFKTYPEATGEKAVKLAKICVEVAKETGVKIIPIVQAVDLGRVASLGAEVWTQHVDWQPAGQWTGFTNLEAIIGAGAKGTLLNHAEHQIPSGTIKQTIARIQKFKGLKVQRFKTMICCRTFGQVEKFVKMKPDFLAYEPKELIGGQISVSEVQPGAIGHLVEIAEKIPTVAGEGIHDGEDVKTTLKLGIKGILVSSAVVLAENPKQKLLELANDYGKAV